MATFVSQFHLSEETDLLQRGVRDFAAKVSDSDIVDGVIVADVNLKSGENNVVGHPLGRPIVGYIVVRSNANSVVFDGEKPATKPANEFTVQCSADVTVTFWVF